MYTENPETIAVNAAVISAACANAKCSMTTGFDLWRTFNPIVLLNRLTDVSTDEPQEGITPAEMRAVRLRLKLSQKEMAFVLGGVDVGSVSRYERGEIRASLTTQMVYRELANGWQPATLKAIQERRDAHERSS